MSQLSERARSQARDKVERLTRIPKGDVDASGWREPLGELGQVQTGPRPVSRRQFRRGGKVHGESATKRADRKPRAAGGVTKIDGGLINEDIKEANKSRAGEKHIGGMKRGGRAHKDMGGLALPNWADAVSRGTGGRTAHAAGGRTGKFYGGPMMGRPEMPGRIGAGQPMQGTMPVRPNIGGRPGMMRADGGKVAHGASCTCAKCSGGRVERAVGGAVDDGTRPAGGRLARKGGGRAKKGMNVNIIIAPSQAKPAMPAPGPIPPGAGPVGLHQAPPPMPPPGAAPPMGLPPAPMMRSTGGRTGYPIDTGAGGARARLEKIKAYGARPA